MIRAFLVLVMIACTAVFGSMAYAQAGNLARSEAEMTRLEALAEAAEQRNDPQMYRDTLGEVVKLGLRHPEIDPLRRARAQQKLANYLFDYESDFVSAKFLAEGALDIFRMRLGETARETLQQRVDLIHFRLQQAEMSELMQRAGIQPQFGTGDPEIDGIVTVEDLAAYRALNDVVEREEPNEYQRMATWANYVNMLVRANQVDAAMSEVYTRMERMSARAQGGERISSDVRFLLLLTSVKAWVAGGRYELALNLYERGITEALYYLRNSVWNSGIGGASSQRQMVRLFVEGFVHLAYRLGREQTPDVEDALRRRAFEVAQLAGFNPAASSVAQQGLSGALNDQGLRRDLVRWSQLSPQIPDQAAEYRALTKRFSEAHPGFAEAVVPEPVSIETLQGVGREAILAENEALILIFNKLIGADGTPGSNGLVVAVTREGSAWAELPLDWTDLSLSIQFLHYYLDPEGVLAGLSRAPQSPGGNVPERSGRSNEFDFKAAHALHDAFFGDPEVAALIGDKPNWIIVPHGEVMSVPFAALVVDEPGGGTSRTAEELRAVRWLGHERALTVIPSVFALKSLRERAPSAPTQMAYLGLGDPAFQGAAHAALRSVDEVAASGANRTAMIRALPRLPGTRREVEELAQLFDAPEQAVLLGERASEAELAALNASGALRQARVLHFATHGLLEGAFEGLSEPALALTPPASSAEPGDGLLTASEAARLDLNADWVILSACDTAGENQINGQGLGGLVQGFFAAGAGNLMVSHWRVDDLAAERLITSTVSANMNGAGKAEALRQAMVALAAVQSRDGTSSPYAHPSLWAPFVLVGGG